MVLNHLSRQPPPTREAASTIRPILPPDEFDPVIWIINASENQAHGSPSFCAKTEPRRSLIIKLTFIHLRKAPLRSQTTKP